MTFEDIIANAPQSVLTKLEGLKKLKERDDYHPEKNCWEHTKIVTERLVTTGNLDLIMSGVFHDIFKAETARINPKNGFPTCPKHDVFSGEFVRTNQDVRLFITEFGANPDRVAVICEQHMRIKLYDEMSPKKQRGLRELPFDTFLDLLTFSVADDMLKEWKYSKDSKFSTDLHRNMWIRLAAEEKVCEEITYVEAVNLTLIELQKIEGIIKWCEAELDTDDYIPDESFHSIYETCKYELGIEIPKEFFMTVFKEWIDKQE